MTDSYPTYGRRPDSPHNPRQVLGVSDHATRGQIEAAYLWLAARELPNRGGFAQRIARLDAARDALLAGAV